MTQQGSKMNNAGGNSENSEEVLYNNEHARVTRRTLPEGGGTVIVKETLSVPAARKLVQEARMLARVAHVEGVVKLADVPPQPKTLVFKDEGGVALAAYLREHTLDAAQIVAYGSEVARILAGIHRAGVIHKDIGPANLLIHPVSHRATVIDFNIAAVAEEQQAETEEQGGIAGTLAYMSPEQTGRTGRLPDLRSDLYSLGVTLYEMAARRRPFEGEDLLELVHAHLVQVPDAPISLNAALPQPLSDVILRLMEKEPDRRYQSAEGLIQDLSLIAQGLQAGAVAPFELGRFDYGVRLKAPAKLLGCEPQHALLREAFDLARAGQSPMVLVSGASGAGKSALIEEFRAVIAPQRPWVVAVQFTAQDQDTEGSGQESLRALGRQLMALPEDQLVQYRERLLKGLEGHMGIGASLLPEFQMLLGAHPAAELAPHEAGKRTALATLALMRSVATPERPLVMIYDDVQWAPKLSLKALDSSYRGKQGIASMLMLCAYSSDVVAQMPERQATLAAWASGPRTRPVVQMAPLSPAAAASFVGQVLRLPEAEARPLADALALRAGNNPGQTLALLNALRNDGLLVQDRGQWHWTADALRRYVGHSSPAELAQRIGTLPSDAAALLQALACLGAPTAPATLALATGGTAASVSQRLAPCVDEGLVLADDTTLRCGNARVQVAAKASLGDAACVALHLALAQRLAASGQAELEGVAAEQFLHAQDALGDEAERRRAAGLLEAAAQRLRLSDPPTSERYLAATIKALAPVAAADEAERMFALKVDHHRALFEQGRLADGDVLYDDLSATASDPTKLLEPTRIQIYGQMNRRRMQEGMQLGLGLLARLDLPKPDNVMPAIGEGFKRVTIWYRGEDKAKELSERPEISDPKVLAWSLMVPETTNPSYFVDLTVWAWLTLEAHRLWVEYGPSPRLMSSIGATQMMLVGTPQDYKGAYTVGRHVLSVGEARGYEPATSFVRCLFGISAGHWVDPIESVVDNAFLRARADLRSQGDESFVSYTYVVADLLIDCKPTLEPAANDVEEGLAMAARSKNTEFELRYLPRRQFIKTLRGQTKTPGHFSTEDFDEAAYAEKLDPTSPMAATYHAFRAMSAAIFGDMPTLAQHIARAVPLSARLPGYYITAMLRALQCLALAEKARGLPADARAPVLEEFEPHFKWLSARAADAPENFLHLQRWVEAERAWAFDSVWAAGAAFDEAVKESRLHHRPWHVAFIHERAALFHLAQGMEHSALPLMEHACETYDAWGAAAKMKELRRIHPFLRASKRNDGAPRSTVVDTGMVDMMAVLRASQALSSETSLARLTGQVGKVLGAITGATGVQLVVHPDEGSSEWLMAASLGHDDGPVTVEQAGAAGDLPLSVFRYVERTGELLVIDDVTRDDRFSSDPYAERHAQCSLLVAPILKQGQLNAMLVLENTQRRNAFRGDRLDSVNMIAGQLSVSLDNALLYASLEKRVAERTAQLRQKTNDINAMLQNMPQGVMTVMAGHSIHPEYSAYLATILETQDIAERNVMDVLFSRTNLGADPLSQVDAAISSCIGEDEMNYEFNSHLLATEFDITMPDERVKSLALSWSPIVDDDGVVGKLMLCVRDVTELKRLEAEANTRKRELQMIGEILAVSQEKFHPFIASSRTFLEENKRLIEQATEKSEEGINLLFRNMHTIKGNARTYGLLGLTNLVHVAEQSYDDMRKDEGIEWHQEKLLAELEAVHTMVETYSHVNDTVLGRKGPGRRGGVEKFLMVERDAVQQAMQLLLGVDQADPNAMREALKNVGSMLNLIGTQPIKDILAGTLESLPSLAQELGKAAPRIDIEDRGIVLRTQASGVLRNVFTHLLRNSVDHGIEAPEARHAKGKTAEGCITLALDVDHNMLRISLRDDGRGLAVAKIRQSAIDKQLITAAQNASAQDVANLIFHSGFSTAEAVTEVSGRGVGMDAVKGFVENEGGNIEIRFLDNHEGADFRPFETVISLPDKFAASVSAAMSFDALRARMQAVNTAAAVADKAAAQ